MKNAIRILAVSMIVLLLCSCGVLSNAAEAESYDFGKDAIPSIKAVLGESREVSGVTTSTENGTQRKQYDYKSDTVYDDLVAYMEYMINEQGWLLTQDMDLRVAPGAAQIAKASADEGKLLVINVSYDETTYILLIQKGEGTLTPN